MPTQLYSNADLRDPCSGPSDTSHSQDSQLRMAIVTEWITILLFPGSKPLIFHLYIIVREIDSCCALNIARKNNIQHTFRPIFLFSSVINLETNS